jgi:hypothetical protein
MDCQLGCPLKALISNYFQGAHLDSACPAQGSASMWASMEGLTRRKFWYPTKNAAIPDWPNECNLQKFHARTQRI